MRFLQACVLGLGLLMAGGTIDFDGGESLAALGFVAISGATNTNGVGEGGSYALYGNDRFDEASYPVTPTERDLCLTFWWDRQVTDGSIYLFEAMAGTSFLWNVSIQVVAGSNNGLIESRAPGSFSDSVSGLWPTTFPSLVRIQISPSVGGTFAGPDNDGVIKIWHGPDINNLTLVYNRSDVPIYDFTKDGKPAYNRFHFAPQGAIDTIVWSDSLCVAAAPLIVDYSTPCCADGGTGTGGGGGGNTGSNPDPIGVLPPWTRSCTGGGAVDTVADLTDGEVW